MRVLFDTNVISELQKPDPTESVLHFYERLHEQDIYLSVVTIGELRSGCARLPLGTRRSAFETWVEEIKRRFGRRILPIDLDAIEIWGEMHGRMKKEGLSPPMPDLLLAASAISNGLHVATRNTRNFALTGAMLINPWDSGSVFT